MQLTSLVVNKVVQGYHGDKPVPIFHNCKVCKQTEAPDRLTAGVRFCTHA